jgi:hypothetical protein
MKNINKQFLLAVMSFSIMLCGCKKDFLDINSNPNVPTDANITAELLFRAGAEGVGALSVGNRASGSGSRSSMQFAQDWVGYMASNYDFARDNTETSYDIDFNFGNTLYLTRYGVLFDLYQAEVKGLATKDTAVAGASIILSAKVWQELVDLFGNLPYSQAFQPNQYPRPVYDDAKDIYADLQKRLDKAIEYMKLTPPSVFPSTDIVNHGDQNLWIKLANTLKLRLLIRQSESSPGTPAEEIAKIMANGGVLEVGESVSVNPGYSNEKDKQNPFYANYGYTPTDVKASTGTGANDYIITILNSTGDPRIDRLFTPIGSSFVGNVYGLPAGDLIPGAATSYVGPGLAALSSGASQNQWIMPDYESLFFKSEAIARGWMGMPGDDTTTFISAIRQSFIFLGVPDYETQLRDYIANSTIANYNDVADSAALVKARYIAVQKYIANTLTDPQESYSDIRRLDFLPDHGYITQHEARVSNTIPVRLLYPQSEYTTNSENVLKQGAIDQFTKKIFWQKP